MAAAAETRPASAGPSQLPPPRPASPGFSQPQVLLPPPASPPASRRDLAAAIASAGGDITPQYMQFRHFATFVAEVGDFALTMKAFRELAFHSGFGSCGGIGLGDAHILFSSAATKGHLTYDGLQAVCRIIGTRLPSYHASVSDCSSDDPQQPATASAATHASSSTSAPAHHDDLLHSPSRASLQGKPPPLPPLPPRPQPSQHTISFADTLPGRSHLSRPGTAPSAGRDRPPSPAGRLAGGGYLLAHEGSGGGSGGVGSRGAGLGELMMQRDPPLVLREVLPLPRCDHRALVTIVRSIRRMYRADEFRGALGALLQLERDWEQAAEELAQMPVKRAPKSAKAPSAFGSSSGSGGGKAAAAPPRRPQVPQPPPADGSRTPFTPLEAAVWLLTMGGCCLMAEGKYDQVQQRLSKAEALLETGLLGDDHPLVYGHGMAQGILHYHRQDFEAGLLRLEKAQELADVIARSTHNMEARKNTAVCWNNRGVCCTHLGRHSEAAAAYRHALRMLQSKSGVDNPEADIALANLNKALKFSFAVDTRLLSRPGSAPSSSSSAEAKGYIGTLRRANAEGAGGDVDAQLSGSSVRLIRFLRQVISTPPSKPPDALPTFATRSDGEARAAAAKKKAAAGAAVKDKSSKDKGGKDKKKGPKKPPAFEARIAWPYPTYGVANVKLPAKKKVKAVAPGPVDQQASPALA